MACGSATGQWLPPFVVYKAKNIYEGWCQGGPVGTAYAYTKSGWFDMYVFQQWFQTVFLPAVKDIPGKKILIGDNLASHLNMEVIDQCSTNGIEFVCFPPNITDKLQPLDVGVFGPFKGYWKNQLKRYKRLDPYKL